MRPGGKVNLIAVVILGAVAYGIWWIITFSGIYLDNLDVKEAVAGAFNESNRKDDDKLAAAIFSKCNLSSLGTHEDDDGWDNVKTMGGLGLKNENVTIVRDEVANRISITVEYQRKVELKPFSKVRVVNFRVAKEGTIPAMN